MKPISPYLLFSINSNAPSDIRRKFDNYDVYNLGTSDGTSEPGSLCLINIANGTSNTINQFSDIGISIPYYTINSSKHRDYASIFNVSAGTISNIKIYDYSNSIIRTNSDVIYVKYDNRVYPVKLSDTTKYYSRQSSFYCYKIRESVKATLEGTIFADPDFLVTTVNRLPNVIDPNGNLHIPGLPCPDQCSLPANALEEVSLHTFLNKFFIRVNWSSTRTQIVNFNNDYLSEQIRVRYAMLDRPANGLSNVILDSFIPRMLYRSKFNIQQAKQFLRAPKTGVCISPWFASMFGLKQLETEQMCRILGFDKKYIKSLFDAIKRKQPNIVFIGYGGTNVNTIHWLTEMGKMTHSINVFNSVSIYEPEMAEVSNLLRFPKDPSACTVYSRRNQQSVRSSIASKLSLRGSDLNALSSSPVIERQEFFDAERNQFQHIAEDGTRTIKHNTILYGAPGISTRERLSKHGNFISATHGDANCRLDLNPHQDTELQVESYGIIQLGGFFMNQLRMAIGLLEVLARDDIDFSAQDQTLMEYSFNGESVLMTDRNYNFQMDFNGLVLTQDQANQAV